MEQIDGYKMHMLSTNAIQVPNLEMELARARLKALWENLQAETEYINNLPKEFLKFEMDYQINKRK